jgi:hypothetical protein
VALGAVANNSYFLSLDECDIGRILVIHLRHDVSLSIVMRINLHGTRLTQADATETGATETGIPRN